MNTTLNPETGEDDTRATPQVRRQWILDRLDETDFVTIKDLSAEFGLTEMSLRRDLNSLAEEGLITRVRGGATRARTQHAPRRYLDLQQRHVQEKTRIARAAVQLLDSARTAFFYSGSTVARVADALSEEQQATLTVVTPSLPVINTVSGWADAHLVAVGGLYLPSYMAFVGPQAVESLRTISADVAIVGCDGLSAAEGLTTPHQLVAEIGTVLIERARQTIVVADSSKIGRRGFTAIAPTTAVDVLVTDSAADPEELDALRDSGMQVHVV
ncbi:DeoR/GlpR family DNA-binding transcription regulator [Amycolatopsis jejuensis]|uniref:DeoR/GlpR family DNA-binding transcription regulator n=1 Tax=Amycolatopsis jejuensis TaxID=330084 RepID=UPI0005252F4F|nr:DeoR/GlpR family DNA-binding transcription regulator [Amycolatopsis jejuensis]